MEYGYLDFREDRCDNSCLLQRASRLEGVQYSTTDIKEDKTHAQQWEHDSLEECGRLVQRTFQSFVVMHVQLPIVFVVPLPLLGQTAAPSLCQARGRCRFPFPARYRTEFSGSGVRRPPFNRIRERRWSPPQFFSDVDSPLSCADLGPSSCNPKNHKRSCILPCTIHILACALQMVRKVVMLCNGIDLIELTHTLIS